MREYRQQRLIPAFMEPRSTVVDPTGEQVVMWSATQVPHILRFFKMVDEVDQLRPPKADKPRSVMARLPRVEPVCQ